MKQVVQNLASGATELMEVPSPHLQSGTLLVATSHSLISAGTERFLVEFSNASLLQKARMQPERVRLVLEKMRTDGLWSTYEAVRTKLDQPLPLGYCNAGRVLAIGAGVHGFSIGDRVLSNGPHAELVRVPFNLCAKIPDAVSDGGAVFAVPGSIALQGVRLAAPTLGETFLVIGLGLIGLLAVQILIANGCAVIGADLDEGRCELAKSMGAATFSARDAGELENFVQLQTRGVGVDAVLITASTDSNEPVRTAAHACRKRGRIVLVGVAGLELSRADFYEKELTFQVSCSYGPGRYDPEYEERGRDYPIGFVRWTEQRNFEAVLQLMASGALRVDRLRSHSFDIASVGEAYRVLREEKSALGIILSYPDSAANVAARVLQLEPAPTSSTADAVLAGLIGAGNYASRMLLPSFRKCGLQLHTLATTGSVQGAYFARKFGFAKVASDVRAVLDAPEINLVAIATRHDSHAQFAIAALNAGKHVFVEKPLAITMPEIDEVETALRAARSSTGTPTLTVGFNRRFAPLVATTAELLSRREGPKSFVYTVNAGAIPTDHWTQLPQVGGGRMVGEACHFIDLLRFLANSPIRSVTAVAMRPNPAQLLPDTLAINLAFEDGSIGAIQYYANGPKSFPKERLEIFANGAALRLENFRRLQSFAWPGFRGQSLWRVDKGQDAMAAALKLSIVSGTGPIIPSDQIMEVARATVRCAHETESRQAGP